MIRKIKFKKIEILPNLFIDYDVYKCYNSKEKGYAFHIYQNEKYIKTWLIKAYTLKDAFKKIKSELKNE